MQKHLPVRKKIAQGVLVAVGASLATTTILQSTLSYGLGMQAFVQGMFTATSAPQAANVGNGVTLTGGYAEIRTPLSGANVISFSPPDISAGCGGINLYMGSFHFINGQEFLALLRTIGQEALGYAFQLAINAMCHQCGALLSSIEKTIQDMNNALHNTCQLAQGIFPANQIMGDFKQVGQNFEKMLGVTSGQSTDVSSAYNSANHEGVLSRILNTYKTHIDESFGITNPNGTTTTETKQVSVPASALTPEGNMFWKAINESQAYNLLSNIDAGTNDFNTSYCAHAGGNACTKEVLMSLVGTEILHPSGSAQSNQAVADVQAQQTQATPNAAFSKNTETVYPVLTLKDLIDGTQKAPVSTCENWISANNHDYQPFSPNMGCELVDPAGTTLGALQYTGIKAHIKHMFYGGGPNNHLGLINYIVEGQALSADQQAFVKTLPGGVYALLSRAAYSKSLMSEVAGLIEPLIVDQYAVKLGSALLITEQSVYTGNPKVIVPKSYYMAIGQIAQSLDVYRRDLADNAQRVNEAVHLLQESHSSMRQQSPKGV
jgi:conjugative transfer pilus assembly protein TraH